LRAIRGAAQPAEESRKGKARLWEYAAVALGQLVVFAVIARWRDLDADEGYYLVAAKLIAAGHHPYGDFWWPQMPLYPYVYGSWLSVFGDTWTAARAASVVLSAGIGALLYYYVRNRWETWTGALLCVVVFVSTRLVFEWFLLAKAYALATLPLLAAVVVLKVRPGPVSDRRWVAVGVLAGIAVDVRLFFAAAVVVLAIHALRSGPVEEWRRRLIAFAGGVLVGVLPSVVLLVSDPDRFFFDNLGYHLQRKQGGAFGSLHQKVVTIAELVNDDPQFLVLLIVTVLCAVAARTLGRRGLSLPLALALVLSAVSLLPNPAYVQDFATIVPFLLIAISDDIAFMYSVNSASNTHAIASGVRRLAVIAVAIYAAVAAINFERSLPGYRGTGLLGDSLSLKTLRSVGAIIDANTRPNEPVLALWPAPLVESHAVPVSGFENDYAPSGVGTAGLSSSDAAKYFMGTRDQIEDKIRNRATRVVVASDLGVDSIAQSTRQPRTDWDALLAASGYRQIASVGLTRIYTAPDQ
jgi:hypothetical protein